MDKKYIIKVIIFNVLWLAWVALSVLFGYLIARQYFPDNIATFIPFSLVFLVAGGAVAFVVYKLVVRRKGRGAGSTADKNSADKSNCKPLPDYSEDNTNSGN